MLSPEVYRETYSLEYLPFSPNALGDAFGLYRMRKLGGTPILTTSPYITDTLDFPDSPESRLAYKRFAMEVCQDEDASYALIKTRDPAFRKLLEPEFAVVETMVTTLVDLNGGERGVWERLHRKRRRQIDRGRETGARFEIGREALLDAFYEVFSITQTRLGTPVHSKKYFESILRHHPEACFVIGFVNQKPACGSLMLTRNRVLYHPYTGTLPQYFSTYLNCTLYWEMIRFGIHTGSLTFDMGRSFLGSGVHQFKSYWGGSDVPLYYCYFLPRSESPPRLDTPALKLATRCWSVLPVWAARLLGPSLIRTVP